MTTEELVDAEHGKCVVDGAGSNWCYVHESRWLDGRTHCRTQQRWIDMIEQIRADDRDQAVVDLAQVSADEAKKLSRVLFRQETIRLRAKVEALRAKAVGREYRELTEVLALIDGGSA